MKDRSALSAGQYDALWSGLSDFIRYNPGARHRRRIVVSILEKLKFKNMLDIGCGKCELALMLYKKYGPGLDYTGVDLSPEVIRENKTRFTRAEFSAMNIEKERLKKKFDLIVCSEVLEHLDDRSAAFRNIVSMMEDGGHLLITVPTGKVFPTEVHFGHTTHPDIDEMKRLGEENRLQLVSHINWGFPYYRLLKVVTNIDPEFALKGFGEGSYSLPSKIISTMLYYFNFLNINSRFGCQLFILYKKV